MTVSNTTNRISAVGSGSAGQLVPFSFPITSTSDVSVIKRVTATGVESTLVETTNYTISIDGTSGGTLTTVTAIETTEQIHIVRATPTTQSLDLVNGGSFNAENIESALDRNTTIGIDNANSIDRALVFPETDPTTSLGDFPTSIDRASKTLTFDSNGVPTATSTNTSGAVSFTAIGTNIAEAANAPTVARLVETTEVINVKTAAYGAAGDNATDDSTAFGAAIDAAITAGIPLYVPKGIYNMGSLSKSITGSLTIIGSGKETTILRDAATLSTTASITVKDITIKDWASGIDIDSSGGNVSGLNFNNVKFIGTKAGSSKGINEAGLTNVISDVRITNCDFFGLQATAVDETVVGIRLSPACTDVVITGNNFQDLSSTNGGSIAIQIGSGGVIANCARVNISNNIINNIDALDAKEGKGVLFYGHDAVISDNFVNDMNDGDDHEGIYTKGYQIACTGNVLIEISGSDADKAPLTFVGQDNSFHNIISNNLIFSTNANNGILCHGGCIISNNQVNLTTTGTGINCFGDDAGSSVDLEFVITGNKVNSPSDTLAMTDVVNTVVTSNVLVSSAGDAIQLALANQATYSAVDILIDGNILSATAASQRCVREVTETDGLVLTNNICKVNAAEIIGYTVGIASVNYIVQNNTINGTAVGEFVTNDATPNVVNQCVGVFKTNDDDALTITDFDGGYTGQIITIIGADTGFTTIAHDATKINLKGGMDCTLEDEDTISLVYDGTDWNEISRSSNNTSFTETLTATVELDSDDIKALAATPITLVAAQGADTVIEFVSAVLIHDAGTAYNEPSAPDNMVIEYATGLDTSASIAATNFLTVTDDEIRIVPTTLALTTDLVPVKNSALRIINTGEEYTAGTGTMTIKTTYRVHTLGL